MAKLVRLSDLFVVGKMVTITHGDQYSELWIQKISPMDHETALRRANQKRAQILSRHETDTADWDIARQEAEDMEPEVRLNILAEDDIQKRFPALQSELESQEEWSKEDYLEGLKDSWGELAERYQNNPEDDEAATVFAEISRYTESLEKLLQGEKESIIRDLETKTDDEIVKMVAERKLRREAEFAWMTEFRKSEIWLGTREAKNHHKRYFDKREEVDQLQQDALLFLLSEYANLALEPLEGKDSLGQPSSSTQSEQPEKQETEEASGREVVSV